MFAQTAVQAAETDPVLKELDTDALYQQVCAKLDRLGGETTAGEVLLRVLLVQSLYNWSAQQTAEQMADSLVLRWFCRLGMQPARERAKSSEGRLRPTYRERWR
jgi:transposase